MLKIREEQLAALRIPLVRRFDQRLLRHVRTHFQEETENRSDAELLDHIRQALDRALTYGLRKGQDLFKYVNVSMIYGPDFDEREETAWLREYLIDDDVPDPSQRAHRLHEAVIHRLRSEEDSMPE